MDYEKRKKKLDKKKVNKNKTIYNQKYIRKIQNKIDKNN
jgi:hypothetical protein